MHARAVEPQSHNFVGHSEPYRIGLQVDPLPDEVLQTCLARMVNVRRFARVGTDFPHHDLLDSFVAFDLDIGTNIAASNTMTCLTEETCEALAMQERFGLDLVAFKQQSLELRGLRLHLAELCEHMDKYRMVVVESQLNARKWAIAVLLPTLRNIAAYTASRAIHQKIQTITQG